MNGIIINYGCVYIIIVPWYYYLPDSGIAPSVSLTIEDGMSLVGEHCPGTVQLICRGVDLSLLRWRYNGIHDIYSFTTTDLPIAFPLFNSALKVVSIELINVTQTPNDARFAEFTSILILDIAQLEFVTNITCGDPGTIDTVPVNTTLLQQSTPISPTITSITATYYSGQLRTVNISWIKLV